MPELDRIRPHELRRVIDVVQEAGVDVSDWANYPGGAERASANPKYCYNWAFVQAGQVVVLNVWHSGMRERGDVITLTDNLRESARIHARQGKSVWKRRAEELDQAVHIAAFDALPIRAVILDGQRRNRADPRAPAATVNARTLDPVPWAVTSYDNVTGEFTLRRGALPDRLVDQFAVGSAPAGPTELRTTSGHAYVRSAVVRARVLQRAAGRCEWCGEYGFALSDGSVFLETHHVIPLSEGGSDLIENVVALCPNHHREAHLGAARTVMRDRLINVLSDRRTRTRAV